MSQEHVEHVVGSHEHSDEDGSWSHVHIYPKDVEHKHANRLSAHIVEDLPAAAPQQLGVMAAKYCPTCGCAVMNEKVHLEWHGHLTMIFESQLKVVETKLKLR